MGGIYDFFNTWRELIIKIFVEYPLAAAVMTLLAIGIFFALQTAWRRERTESNLLLVFVGWLIAVPILGSVMAVLSGVWAFIEATFPILAAILGSFYHIYVRHPYMVLIILALGLAGYFVWNRRWPRRPQLIQNRAWRLLCVLAGIVVLVHIASPIADLFSSKADATAQPVGTDQKKAP
jgi:hypothetical protein